jgi:MIP family channel proteins
MAQLSCRRTPAAFAVAATHREGRVRDPQPWNAYLAEGLGIFLFFFTGITAGYVLTGDPAAVTLGVALAHGLALAVMVSAFGAVSGGHFNPAVTVALWSAGKIETVKAVGYLVVQLAVSWLAAAVAWYVVSGREGVEAVSSVPALGQGVDMLQGIAVEAIATAGLLVAVFGTAVDRRSAKLGGLIIGIALTAGILAAGPLTGGALNPARWFGPALFERQFENALVWIVGPLLGALVVGLVYRTRILPEADQRPADAD